MKKTKLLLSVAGLLFFTAGVLSVGMFINKPTNVTQKAAAATKLSISPATQDVSRGQDAYFTVQMDTDTNSVTGIDVQINFDPKAIQISSLKKGDGAVNLDNTIINNFDNNTGTLNYAIFTLNKGLALQGSDIEVLQIRAKIVSDAPEETFKLEFDPSSAISATSESSNALLSHSPGSFTVTIDAPQPTDSPTDTPQPTATPRPTVTPGEPNSCGGTCGSNLNCAANLFCYEGYCRNPSCSRSEDCSCNSTPEPEPEATNPPANNNYYDNSPESEPEGTQEPVVVDYTPEPDNATEDEGKGTNFWASIFTGQNSGNGEAPATPAIDTVNLPESKSSNFLPWIIGSLLIAGVTLIFIVIGIVKEANKNTPKPPLIKV